MSKNAVGALEAEVAHATALILSLTPEEWAAPSGCTDWRVQDVICHMASVFHTIADPSTIDGGSSEDAEENAEVPVQARREHLGRVGHDQSVAMQPQVDVLRGAVGPTDRDIARR